MKVFLLAFAIILLFCSFAYAQNESKTLDVLNKDCKLQFECQAHGLDYWYGCFYDNETANCRCLVGEFSRCEIENSSINLDDWCAYRYECQPHNSDYWTDCFYDKASHECRCYVGDFFDCRIEKSSIKIEEQPENITVEENLTVQEKPVTGKAVGVFESSKERIKNFWAWLLGLERWFKAGSIALAAVVVVVVVLLYCFLRDSPANNLRKARRYHRLAEKCHEQGKEEKAQHYYELSEMYRTRAA